MREREKEDIVIDICPNCRGIFLDAGELEKLTVVEDRYYRSRGYRDDDDDDDDDDDRGRGERVPSQGYRQDEAVYRDDARYRDDQRYRDDPRYREDPRYDPRYSQQRPKKKGGFLSNMFESFGGGEGGMDD
jgi:Zn-finger nucleic acid-binding protein